MSSTSLVVDSESDDDVVVVKTAITARRKKAAAVVGGAGLSSSSTGPASPSVAPLTSADEEAYLAFLQESAAKEAADAEAELKAAGVTAGGGSTGDDAALREAMAVIDATIAAADQYNKKMTEVTAKVVANLKLTQPALVTGGKLRDYQLEGMQWLARKCLTGESGIIADEMGLGKTLQVISFMAWLIEQGVYHPMIVVCPLSVVGNWCTEIKRFAPSLDTTRYLGKREEREAMRLNKKAFPPECKRGTGECKAPMPILVTSYQVAMNDADFLSLIPWRVLVIDEGHRIKNEGCAFRRVIKTYTNARDSAQVKVLLTGTPVQNDLTELWSLCNFVMPGVFKDKNQFLKVYRYITRGTSANTSYYKEGEMERGIVTKLHSLLERYMLRRTKDEVHLSLPPKAETLVYTRLTAEQVHLLKAIRSNRLAEGIAELGWVPAEYRETVDWDVKAAAGSAAGVNMNNKAMQLRKACVHPFWIAEPLLPPHMPTDHRIVESCGKMIVLDRMLTHLRAMGHKVLIFSQFTTVLDMLCDYWEWRTSAAGMSWAAKQYGSSLYAGVEARLPPGVDARTALETPRHTAYANLAKEAKAGVSLCTDGATSAAGAASSKSASSAAASSSSAAAAGSCADTVVMPVDPGFTPVAPAAIDPSKVHLGDYRTLSGETPALDRDTYISEFNNDPDNKIFAFFLSTKAGGQGINLASADTVIFYDSDWNPTGDAQAMDRAHRIGQTRPVIVYRLVTEGASVESRMVRTAASKGGLARMVLQEGKHLFGGLLPGAAADAGAARDGTELAIALPGDGRAAAISDSDTVSSDVSDDDAAASSSAASSAGGATGRRSTRSGGRATPTSKPLLKASHGRSIGRLDERVLEYWLNAGEIGAAGRTVPAAATAASSAAGASPSATAAATAASADAPVDGSASTTPASKLSAQRHVLTIGGISPAELSVILDRGRALQAGKRCTDAVEAKLQEVRQASADADAASARGTADVSAGASGVGALAASPAHSSAAGADGTPSVSGRKRPRPGSTPASAGHAADTSSVASSPDRFASPAAAGAAASAAAASSDAGKASASPPPASGHAAVPPRPSSMIPSRVISDAERDQLVWEGMACRSLYTPPQGDGYEFVYHITSGILRSGAAAGGSDVKPTSAGAAGAAAGGSGAAAGTAVVAAPTESVFSGGSTGSGDGSDASAVASALRSADAAHAQQRMDDEEAATAAAVAGAATAQPAKGRRASTGKADGKKRASGRHDAGAAAGTGGGDAAGDGDDDDAGSAAITGSGAAAVHGSASKRRKVA